MRTVYGGVNSGGTPIASVNQPLAYCISNMSIDYILSDGTIVTLPTAPPLDNQLAMIRMIRVTLTLLGPDTDPLTHKLIRTKVQGSYATRNIGYDKN